MKTVALVQARMGSSRLPGKVMKNVGGIPLIEFLLRRLSKSSLLDQIVVATSVSNENIPLLDHVSKLGFSTFEGEEHDVLDRFYKAARQYNADVVVRITGDCPFIDPILVDELILAYREAHVDYVSNTLPPTFPDGLDIEVFSIEALKKAFDESTAPSEREHVTPYIRHSGKFTTRNVLSGQDFSSERWTVDEDSDLKMIDKIVEHYSPDIHFGWEQVINFSKENPEIFTMNQNIIRNEGYIKSKLAEIKLRKVDNFKESVNFKKSIHNLIPGGAHTYSKGDDQFPELSPAAVTRGKGSHIWDVDGNEYLDCSMGLTSVSLGHAYQPVIDAVENELGNGVNFQRPSFLEKKMAEAFLELVPQHDMVKFAKNGSAVTSAAVKLARAKTGRKLIAFPIDHPFYSYDDWFIGTTPCNAGVPEEIATLSVTFKSFDINSLKDLFEKYPGEIAGVITEPEKSLYPPALGDNFSSETFLNEAIDLCHANGALFISDEMVTGFKTALPGTISKFNLKPDMATWGKGIANGFSFCALTGTKEVMELGGINRPGAEKVFLISTTHGGETHAMSAALATIDEFKSKDVIKHNQSLNKLLSAVCKKLVTDLHMDDYVSVVDCEWMPTFVFKNSKREVCVGFRTLFMQEMIRNGVLFQGIFVASFSHTEDDIYYFSKAFHESLKVYNEALAEGYEKYLVGEPAKAVFRKTL